MQLSVVIVNYNVKYFLEQCLHSVRKAAVGMHLEVFVVDNDSVDGSVEMVREKFPEVILIANKQNTGFSKANNQAMRIAKGRYVLLLNPDTVVQEDTFRKTVEFMDQHPDAGGLGVKMIDGKGHFLPESKRGLPTPFVAFSKIFGLAALFPKSRLFGRYHLGFLSKEEVHRIDVLSGAFMLMRKEALDKVGLLDEDFFMYGEDIDLSYRIQKGGYENYYYPDTQIIHYKGESTKKSSVNYVFVFYNAMIIFARKHFSNKNAALFSFLINLAVYLRAGMALFSRLLKRITLPLTDIVLIYTGIYLLKTYWESHHKYVKVPYSAEFMLVMVPVYIACWLTGMYLSGGYDKPIRLTRVLRGIVWGTLSIATLYAFLNNEWRFSRALIVLGASWAAFSTVLLRVILSALKLKSFRLESKSLERRLVIVAHQEEGERILELMMQSSQQLDFIGFVTADSGRAKSAETLGSVEQLEEVIAIYKIDEVVFSGKDLSAQTIMSCMATAKNPLVEYKIAPEDSLFIIGSNSSNNRGDFYTVGINFSIDKPINRRNKRVLDILLAVLLLVLSPLLVFWVKKAGSFLGNIFRVLFGQKTWVGYAPVQEKGTLPKLKPGVIAVEHPVGFDDATLQRLNVLYARHYQVENDLWTVFRNSRSLGEYEETI